MYTILTNRRDAKDRDEGFTLIELMVVVLIIAILLAIAIPTFLGAQSSAKDRGAQSSARNALTAAKTIYADTGDYSGAIVDDLKVIEPNLVFQNGASTKSKEVSVLAAPAAKVWYAAVLSDAGECFYIRDSIDTATGGNPGTMYARVTPTVAEPCIASATVPAAGAFTTTGWDS